MQVIQININGQTKTIGTLQDGVLYLKRSKARHFFRKLKAYGIDYHVVKEVLPQNGCREIQLYEEETGNVYRVSLETFLKKGIFQNHQGHGPQLLLPLRYWEEVQEHAHYG